MPTKSLYAEFNLAQPCSDNKDAEFNLINGVSNTVNAEFNLITGSSDSKNTAYHLAESYSADKGLAFDIILMPAVPKDAGFRLINSNGFSSLPAGIYVLRHFIQKPLELRLIEYRKSMSKTSSFALTHSILISSVTASASYTEVASSAKPILYKKVDKTAEFDVQQPAVTVEGLDLSASFSEVPVAVQVILHKTVTKNAGFAFEAAKWVTLENTDIDVSPVALCSELHAILHKQLSKSAEFEIDTIEYNALSTVSITGTEVWTGTFEFAVVPGSGAEGSLHTITKKLSFAIEHDVAYDDTSEEYFSETDGFLHPYNFSPVKHKHDDFYPTKNEVFSTYALNTTKVKRAEDIVPDNRGGLGFRLVVITSTNLASWQSGNRSLSWTFRWEHLGLGFGPIGLTSDVGVASFTLDLKTFLRLYLAVVEGNLAEAGSTIQNIWNTYFDQVAYFYKHGTLDGHPSGDYSAEWDLTIWNSAGASADAWDSDPTARGYLYTSRWDPHKFNLMFYRQHPAYLVADYHIRLPEDGGGRTPKVVTAVAYPGGEVPSGMTIETMVSPAYTGQSLMGRSYVSRAHTGFSIRGINGDTIIVRSFGKPFYIIALVTYDNTFEKIDEWDTSPDRFLSGNRELKSAFCRIPAKFEVKKWLVG